MCKSPRALVHIDVLTILLIKCIDMSSVTFKVVFGDHGLLPRKHFQNSLGNCLQSPDTPFDFFQK